MTPMTEAEFARSCVFLAKTCAEWAGGALTLPERYSTPVSAETVARFTSDIRKRLAIMERHTMEGRNG